MSPSNYSAIRDENRIRYGTDIGRIGPMLLADRYDDRTHFIFELLQNAEDALGRRDSATGSRNVNFALTSGRLTVSHCGKPFDEADVRGICGIAESTKDQHSIGRFGIGFKSVYTFTERPEIHSGDEDFAIENYVQPVAAPRLPRGAGQTQIILPLKAEDTSAEREIAAGFQQLGPKALLFLRHIDEINWSVEGGSSGVYLRGEPESLSPGVQRIKVIGQETDRPEVDESWLVFHHDVCSTAGEKVGRVEIAFALTASTDEPDRWAVQPLAVSPLVVFFPTVVSTNLGFLVQGPYRTTPSRDNVPRNDPWNQELVQQTADLLVEAVRWLRDNEMLDVAALRCLPTDRGKFAEGAMFAPLFDAMRDAFLTEPLLPRFGGGYVMAGQARLARTQELRELFNAQQLEVLLATDGCAWLSGDITQDRAPELRAYLLKELQVPETTPEMIVAKLDRKFLEAQSDEWVTRLYAFLGGQRALAGRFGVLPLVRLESGKHVTARSNGMANAFLPSDIETGFPTVRHSVCATAEARGFLISLGVTAPDPVDDVVRNVLPKYRQAEVDGDEAAYTADMGRILVAFSTDSKSQKEKLLAALRETGFVMSIDTGDGEECIDQPSDVYLATDRLKALFSGVPGVRVVDDSYECLRGEPVRELLEACGALRYLRPVPASDALTWEQRRELRRNSGYEHLGQSETVTDWNLDGLEALLSLLPSLSQEQRAERARLLWEALGDLEERRGRGVFDGSYAWTHYGNRKAPPFPAAFLRQLNDTEWVPDAGGELARPALVTFESLGWKPNPFLLSRIAFKPPIIDQLAKEVGIEAAALDLLRKHGITSFADLATRLGISNESAPAGGDEVEPEEGAASGDGQDTEPAGVDSDVDEEAALKDSSLGGAEPTEIRSYADESDADADHEETEESGGVGEEEAGNSKGARESRSTDRDRRSGAGRQGLRNIAGQAGLDEQGRRLGRRVASFFGATAPGADDEDEDAKSDTAWRTRLVCFEAAAGGLQLETGPLEALPSFVKKLRVVGGEGWDAFALAANAKLHPTRVSVRPGTGPWRWEAVGFEDEEDLGLDRLALEALSMTTPLVFRVDADGVGQLAATNTLSLGQSYRLLLPPGVGENVGAELDDGWRIWSLDLAAELPSTIRETLKSLGLQVGEAWPRLEWAVTAASAWRTNRRGDSYPVFESGSEFFVSVSGVPLDDEDGAMLFLHGPTGTARLELSSDGIVSFGAPAPGLWACALVPSRTSVRPTTLLFEVGTNTIEAVAAEWSIVVPEGLGSIEATAPPGWPVAVRWGGIAAHEETIAVLYGNDDGTVSFDGVHPLLEARASRSSIADLLVDFRELGRRVVPHDGRASLAQIREQVITLWQQRSGLVQSRKGMWLQLIPAWFEPITSRLGYGLEPFVLPANVDVQYDLVAWLLTVDERRMGSITRSPSRVLVLTTDMDSVLREMRQWIDDACVLAKVRDAIVTDGTRWTVHRMGDRQLMRRAWSLDDDSGHGSMDDMLNELTEGL